MHDRPRLRRGRRRLPGALRLAPRHPYQHNTHTNLTPPPFPADAHQSSLTSNPPADPCAAAPAECAEPHPAAVCALPAQGADDDDALAAVDHFQNMQQLSAAIGRFVFGCADLLSTGQCAAWRAQIPTLDTICGLSCAPLRTVSERFCTAATLPKRVWGARTGGRAASTPAAEFPSVRDVCEAGMPALVQRTKE